MDPLDDAGADLVDPVLIEADDDRGRAAVPGDEVAAHQIVGQRELPYLRRIARVEILEQRPDVYAAVIGAVRARLPDRQRLDDRRRRQAVDLLHGVNALDVAGDLRDRAQRRPGKEEIGRIGLERDDEHARAGKLGPQTLVVLVD